MALIVGMMQEEKEELYDEVVKYFNDNKSTVRETAEACNTSKSTVHTILTKYRSNSISKAILADNKKDAPRRGGKAVHRKYKGE